MSNVTSCSSRALSAEDPNGMYYSFRPRSVTRRPYLDDILRPGRTLEVPEKRHGYVAETRARRRVGVFPLHYANTISMLNKLGHTLRFLGRKMANAASWLGHKVGGELAAISPVVSLFNLVINVGAASAGMVLKGVGALGDAEKTLNSPGGL